MDEYSRREFLRRLSLGIGAFTGSWFLDACSPKTLKLNKVPTAAPLTATNTPFQAQPSEPASPEASPTPTAAGEVETPTPASKPQGIPDLVVARNAEPEDLVRRAMAALGGMNQYVHSGDDVIIKPNICVAYHTYEYAATTNPWVVAALVKMSLESGAKRVRVMDFPFGGSADEAYARSGIQQAVVEAGGEMETMPLYRFARADIPDGVDVRQLDIYQEILNANVVINVPIAKHHGLAKLTLGMKNLLGVVKDRPSMHHNIGQRLADLASRVRPALTVVDAVRILTANGPTGGNLEDVKKLDTIIISPDIVAADAYGATLFGMRPDDLDYVRAGVNMGLGKGDLTSLKIEEI
jgi:uncharacterized protein (DUF362 family)